jgi:hypothetical protein
VKKHLILSIVILLACSTAVFAAPAPSKTASNQSIEARNADLALVRDVVANEQIATALAAHGFSQEQVQQRLSQLNSQDLHQLANNLDQLQAAGLTRQEWLWIGIGAAAVLIILAAVS